MENINTDLPEGRLLIAALSQLSAYGKYAKMQPEEILREMFDLANEIYPIPK